MFRPIRRKKNELSADDGITILKSARRGVLAMNGTEGYPYAIPVNYFYDEDANKIYFHGAKAGHKVDALKACDKICFTVYGDEIIKEEAWAPYLQSVVIFGRCHLVEDRATSIDLVTRLAEKYYPSKELVDEGVAASGAAVQMFEIEIDHISAKQVQEK